MRKVNIQKHERPDLDILCVIVLYKIKLEQSATYLSMLNSFNKNKYNMDVLVYDNSPDDTEYYLSDEHKSKIIYIADKSNSGVSKAYNVGAELALKMKKKWILLLDQDTIFPVQTIQKYLTSIKTHPDGNLFAPFMLVHQNTIISPCHFKFMRGFSTKKIKPGVSSLNEFSVINCGMCIDVGAFKRNGGYNELLKLDFSDHDFIRRFKKAIGDKFIIIDLKVDHQLSSAAKNTLKSDIVRFDYYLDGAKHISSSPMEKLFLKINAALRALKLFLTHRDVMFLTKLFKWI